MQVLLNIFDAQDLFQCSVLKLDVVALSASVFHVIHDRLVDPVRDALTQLNVFVAVFVVSHIIHFGGFEHEQSVLLLCKHLRKAFLLQITFLVADKSIH